MNEEQAFLAAIAANPSDVTARLVFADWLAERDDPRGEWLRVRTQLALGTVDRYSLPTLFARERELAPDALASWFATDAPVWCLLGGGLPNPPVPEWLVEENVESWRWMIDFYADLPRRSWEYTEALQQFVEVVAGTEVAKLFRAGQSLVTFIVSTADRHGLSDRDAWLGVEVSQQTPRFRLQYHGPHQSQSLSAQCEDEAALRFHFGQFLARLWCNTRGAVAPGA
jgi:uncharacterized protein (TIGR02996 family)